MAVVYATAVEDNVHDVRRGATLQAGQIQLALCPATRTGQSMGRQVDGRMGTPLATMPGLLPAARDAISPTNWIRFRLASLRPAKPNRFEYSGRITRGPPGPDSTSIES